MVARYRGYVPYGLLWAAYGYRRTNLGMFELGLEAALLLAQWRALPREREAGARLQSMGLAAAAPY